MASFAIPQGSEVSTPGRPFFEAHVPIVLAVAKAESATVEILRLASAAARSRWLPVRQPSGRVGAVYSSWLYTLLNGQPSGPSR
jgi:hypothetical protein